MAYTMLFNQLVLSRILVYSCIWGHREFPKVKSIQTAAMRFFLGVGTSCPNTGLFGEMGLVPLQAEIKFAIIKFWHRICSLPTHRLPNIIHRWSSQKGLGNWADETIKLFPDISLSNFSKMDRNSFLKEVWNRILQVEYSKWLDNLNSIAPNWWKISPIQILQAGTSLRRICYLANVLAKEKNHCSVKMWMPILRDGNWQV